jgi:hypothetical protein
VNIKLTFQFNDNIIIELLDLPAIRSWFNHARNIYSQRPYKIFGEMYTNNPIPVDLHRHWASIKNSLSQLEKLGYRIPPLNQELAVDQPTLNRLHRFFTYNIMWYNENEIEPVSNPFDPNFKLPNVFAFEWWNDILEPINASVHELEYVTGQTYHRQLVNEEFPIHYIGCVPLHVGTKTCFKFNKEDYVLNYNNYMNCSYEYPVLLNDSILGKSVLRSFYDYDDPTAKDCTGRSESHGGFIIDLSDNRKKIYQSETFQNWLESYKLRLDNTPLEFIIGYVKHSTAPLAILRTDDFLSIEFID